MMITPLSDIIDRYSIVKLKTENLPENKECKKELKALEDELTHYSNILVPNWIERLYTVNAKIWALEADIRQGKEGLLGLEEVGRRAIKIRDFNGERIKIKNEISKLSQIGFQEIKINHGSE